MQGRNFRENDEYFSTLALEVAGDPVSVSERVRPVLPRELKVGDLVKFTYARNLRKVRIMQTKSSAAGRGQGKLVEWRDYTTVVASTPRAPFGSYVARNTKNWLITMFLIDNLNIEEQGDFLTEVYESGNLQKMELAEYAPRGAKITKLDDDKFKTFIASSMFNCKVLK
tara:strand:+ start:84 stop:590 length:507 start_codon:yes stop_codon:yes gene_type:complete